MRAFFVLSLALMKQHHHLESANREKREGGRILRAFFGRVILHLLFFLEEEL